MWSTFLGLRSNLLSTDACCLVIILVGQCNMVDFTWCSIEWSIDVSRYTCFNMVAVRHYWLGANFGTTHNENLMIYHCAKFGCDRIGLFDNTKVWIFCAFSLKTPIHAFFGCFGSKIWGKWKVSELLSLYECNNLELTSYEANCIKISSTV